MYSNCTKTRVWELCSEWRGCKYFLKKFKLSLTQGYKCGAPRYRSLREQYYSPLHPKLWLKVTLVWHKINSLMHSVRIEFSSSNLLRDELAINIFHFFFFSNQFPSCEAMIAPWLNGLLKRMRRFLKELETQTRDKQKTGRYVNRTRAKHLHLFSNSMPCEFHYRLCSLSSP